MSATLLGFTPAHPREVFVTAFTIPRASNPLLNTGWILGSRVPTAAGLRSVTTADSLGWRFTCTCELPLHRHQCGEVAF
jgi:hypothetical protein